MSEATQRIIVDINSAIAYLIEARVSVVTNEPLKDSYYMLNRALRELESAKVTIEILSKVNPT